MNDEQDKGIFRGDGLRPGSVGITIARRELFAGAAVMGAGLALPIDRLRAATLPIEPPRLTGSFPQRSLLKADLTRLLDQPNLSKPVHDSMIVDDMEQDGGWHASDVVSLTYTTERAKTGSRSLRFRTQLRNEAYIRSARAKNGSFTGQGVLFAGMPFSAFIARRLAPAQDWTRFNRISLWCYLHPTDNPVNSLSIQFLCDGAEAGPHDPISAHYFGDIRPGEWNHLTWEIPEHTRDRISQIVIFQPLEGTGIDGTQSEVAYDFDALAVERVDAERVGGWEVTPGKIAYSHLGYQPAGMKIAVAPSGDESFALLDAGTGAAVATLPAKAVSNHRGAFSLLDFSGFARPGTYKLRHGQTTSEAFAIGTAAWRPLVEGTLNAFYGFRCGFAVEHVHDACHLDVYAEYRGERRSVGGGWHDAANLTQGPYRTHLSIYALIELHDALMRQGHTALAERALEEARWGLEWSIRCRFGPGLRVLYGEYSYWTDSKSGTIDDVVQEDERAAVGRDGFQNTLAALAADRAARLLKARDPKLAAILTRAAQEDFADVLANFAVPKDAPPLEINVPSWRDQIAYLTLSATELLRTTGDARYADHAARFARLLEQTQERGFVDGIAVTGYFYEDAGRTRIAHEYHNSFEDSGLLAFAALCETLPDHPDWGMWYAGLVAYADHFCSAGSHASAPFNILPAAVWRRADLDAPLPPDQTGQRLAKAGATPVFPTAPTPELIRSQMLKMFEDGVDLGADHRLRVFPLWSDHVRHGATTVHMSKTIGLSAAAGAMGRADLSDLAARQLQWTIGGNPLSRSVIYGIGHDFWQNFTAALPNFVGGMSLGFNSYSDDAPAWGNNAIFPYKEQWVYSSCRVALNLARIGTPASVKGDAPMGAVFRNQRTGEISHVLPGHYALLLPAGDYEVRFGDQHRMLSLAHATSRTIDLDPKAAIAGSLERIGTSGTQVRLRLTLTGSGEHRLTARSFNGKPSGYPDTIDLGGGKHVSEMVLNVSDPDGMWFVAIVPDGRLGDRIELSGSVKPLRQLA